ncbi:hypothetical protein [Cellulomonas pakistanensis]|uniref:Uncharacterized protein n=1 Tax=Cellulomonas pakistanensis TaxID=992287 RepID=A0A919P9J1_9CELL|nr:hypothetical protein [Cellulomonas pakistanensis]GIG36885.1 hypothetical protein Cpa01nite_22660 [Cellulomonas pakistanensis]
MPIFSRRALPDDVRRALDLPAGDRVLAAARSGDRWLAATRLALYVVGSAADAGAGPVRRHLWSDVDRASFAPEPPAITVHWVTGSVEELPLDPPVPVAFAQTLRERIQSSVVHVESVTVPGAGPVRVALRRGEAGELFTQVIGTGRVDLADPAVAALLDEVEARVRAAAGLRA